MNNSTWTENFQMFNLHFKREEKPEIKLPTSIESKKKQENFRKTSASLTMLKPLTVWITTNCGKFLERWEYQNTLPAPCEISTQVQKQQLEPDMEELTGSKLWKEFIKTVHCHPVYLTYMQSLVQFSGSVVTNLLRLHGLEWKGDTPWPGFPVHHQVPELAQLMFIESVMPSDHLILCCLPLLLPSIFPSLRVFLFSSLKFIYLF